MLVQSNLKDLTEQFARLGARDPASWAKSQLSEGIEQLHRFLFLRQAWRQILPDGDTQWIAREVQRAKAKPTEPYSGIGLALARCLERGVDPRDLSDIVRGTQAEALFSFCYLLEDPGFEEPELEDVGWCLVVTDKNLDPTARPINGLHESVLGTDPTGREMRARDA